MSFTTNQPGNAPGGVPAPEYVQGPATGRPATIGTDGTVGGPQGSPLSSQSSSSPAITNAALASTEVQLGSVSGQLTFDLSKGQIFVATLTGNAQVTAGSFVNWPSSPAVVQPVLVFKQDGVGGRTVDFSVSGIFFMPSGSQPQIASTPGAVTYVSLLSSDQGATIIGDALASQVATLQAAVQTLQGNLNALQTQAASGLYVVQQGASATVPRPSVPGKVLWVGSAKPNNAALNDMQATNLTVLLPPPALVQQASQAASLSAGATSLAVPISTLPNLPTVNNTLFMAVAGAKAVTSVVDPEGNVWAIDQAAAAGAGDVTILRTTVVTAYLPSDQITVNFAGQSPTQVASLAEFMPLPANPLDVTATNSGTGATSLDSGQTAATSEAIELVIAAFAISGSPGMLTTPAGYTLLQGSNVYSTLYFRWLYTVTSAAGPQHAVLTTTTARGYTGATACYRGS